MFLCGSVEYMCRRGCERVGFVHGGPSDICPPARHPDLTRTLTLTLTLTLALTLTLTLGLDPPTTEPSARHPDLTLT
jgi:hypothetical protein